MVFPIGAMVAGDPFQSLQRTQEAGLDQAGQAALGRGIQQMFQPQLPNAIPMSPQGQQGFDPAGAIRRFFGGQPQAQAGPPMSASPGGPQQAAAPYAQSMAIPQQPPPQQSMRPPPQQGGGMNPAQALSGMNFQQILQKIVEANPGASPSVIGHALKAAMPFMNTVALDQYRQAQLGLGQERIYAQLHGQDTRAQSSQLRDQAGMIRALVGQGYTLEEALQQVQTQMPAQGGAPQPVGGVPQPAPAGVSQPGQRMSPQPQASGQPSQTIARPYAGVASRFPAPAERMESIDEQGQTISDPPRIRQATATEQGMQIPRSGTLPEGATQIAQSDTYKPPANLSRLGWDETALRRAAQRYIDTGEYPHNLGTRPIAAQITGGINHYVNEIMREQNLTSQDVIKKQTQYGGEKAYQRSAAQQSARVESAANEVEQLIPQAIEASKNFQRYDYTLLNELYEKWKRQESDPRFNDFLIANFSLANAYGRSMNPLGQPRIAERKERELLKILSEQTGHAGYVTQVRRLWKEVQASKKAQSETQQGRKPGDINAPMPGDDPSVPAAGGGASGFDVEGALKAGYTQDEINAYLAKRRKQ